MKSKVAEIAAQMHRYAFSRSRFIILICSALLSVGLQIGATAQARAQISDTLRLTLEETVESAISGNPDVLLAQLSVKRANSQLRAVNGGFLPQVGIDGQYTRNLKRPVFFLPAGSNFPGAGGGGSEGVTVIEAGSDNSYQLAAQANVPIYSRELILNSRAAKTAVNVNERGLDISRNDIRMQVKKAYYDVLLAQESLKVLQQSLQNAQRNFENTRNQFAQELVPQYDVIRSEVQVENIRPDILQAENSLEAATSNLKLLANIPDEIPVVLVQTLQEFLNSSNTELLTSFGVENNPSLKQLDVQEMLQEQQVQVQQSSYFPSVSAFGNYAYQSQANNFNFREYLWVRTSGVGLQLSVPVFQGFVRSRQIEQAKLDLEQVQIQKQYMSKSLTIQAKNALNRVKRARAALAAQEKNIAQAQKGFEIAQVSYRSGVGTFIDANDAELALTQSRLSYLEVVYEYLNAIADFEQLTGGNGTGN
ncbi:TolC family protein [Pontibacter sp. SGAir0037]|uniref:TolC family protein n=1 Tax=Pontibacter sp. SGAir0037 TaxID=2571030 RepID=UPI00143D0B3B|nr:TolC family protein [Pontibacter sp. SGAir0037]